MAIVVQYGAINTNSVLAPTVIVQILPPSQNNINGVPTNIVGIVGTATWGPKNSPSVVGSLNDYVTQFGAIQTNKYDMGTPLYAATLQFANNFRCVRVTDGTDTSAFADILDTAGSPLTGLILTALYTGETGNNLIAKISTGSAASTYKIIIALPNQFPEVFDNIGGSGVTFWENLANAINYGQNGDRGPSQLVVASLNTFISSVTVGLAGSYATLPTLGTTGNGSGAVLVPTMKVVSGTPAAAGTGYIPTEVITLTGGSHTISGKFTVATTKLVSIAVNAGGANYIVGDTITLAGGTFGTAAVLTVSTVSGGAITGVTISTAGSYTANTASFTQGSTSGVGSGATFNTAVWGVNTVTVNTAGAYTALPSSPVSQGSTTGSGTGATFTVLWGLLSIAVSSQGTGYDSTSALSITGGAGTGGGTGTLNIGSANTPALGTYTFAGGTNGNNNITPSDLIGVDTGNRTGMYALRNTQASIGLLSDCDDSSTYSTQESFAESEGIYMLEVGSAGQTPAQGKTALEESGVDSYDVKFLLGDWIYMLDPFNNQTRLVSPQGYVAGRLANLSPERSSLNQPILGIVGTQMSFANRIYSQADIVLLSEAGIDVIANPSPGGDYFATQTGQNTSSNSLINDDGYTRLTNYLAYSIASALGIYIGKLQTPSVRLSAKTTIQSFLQNLVQQNMIGDVNGGPNYKVVLDASNNPSQRVVKGYMQANVQVVNFHVIRVFLVNLQNGEVTLQSTSPNQ